MGVKVCTYRKVVTIIKVKVGNDQEMAQSESKNSHSKNRGEKKKYNQVLILRKHIVSRVSSYFPNHEADTQLPKLN